MRLNPYHPERFWNHLGRAYFVARRYAEAIDAFSRIGARTPTTRFGPQQLAQMGDATAAKAHAEEVLRRERNSGSIDGYMMTLHYRHEEVEASPAGVAGERAAGVRGSPYRPT